jgi:hypothetical protein
MILGLLLGCHHEACAAGRVCAVIGSGDSGFNGDGPALTAWLYLPSDVGPIPDGRLAVMDYNNYRLRALDPDGTLTTVAGDGTHGFSIPGQPALESPLENPIAFTVGPDGLLYIAAEHEGRVLQVDAAGVIQVIAGTGDIGFQGDGGDALLAWMSAPGGVAFGDEGEMYVSDGQTARVRVVRDGIIDTVIGGGEGDLGPGTTVALERPARLRWDDGRLLVADAGRSQVLAWDPASGKVTDAAPGCDLSSPSDARADSDGSIWIADTNHHELQRVVDGGCETMLGDGIPGVLFDRGASPTDSVLSYPAALYFDGADVFVANQGGHQVVRWQRD